MIRWVRVGAKIAWLTLSAALLLGSAGVALHAEYLPRARSLPGTRLLEQAQPDGSVLGSWLASLRDQQRTRQVVLDAGDAELKVTLADLGIDLDVERTQLSMLHHAEQGGVIERMRRALRARRGQESVPPAWSFDATKAIALLDDLAPGLAREPQDARLELEHHRKVPDVSGRQLDVAATLPYVEALTKGGGERVTLAFRELPATVRLAALTEVDVSQVLASFETDFKGKAGRRKVNIERAVSYLNGTIIGPGEVFSFNKTVGERSYKRGFVDAPVIVDDVMEPGIGGGVCQVASTLFAASIHGNLEVLHRRSHSRPTGYTPLGLDAAVIDGEVDLRLKNPHPVPLLVHAFLPTETTIKVELLGHKLAEAIEHKYGVTERHDFVRRVKFMDEVKEPKRKQKGNYGYDVVSVVRIPQPGGKPLRRSYSSTYYPVPEVYWVPQGYDLSLLPPLPEGAVDTIVGDKPIANEGDGSNLIAEPPS